MKAIPIEQKTAQPIMPGELKNEYRINEQGMSKEGGRETSPLACVFIFVFSSFCAYL